jgi:hypothetical protein
LQSGRGIQERFHISRSWTAGRIITGYRALPVTMN